ncbi:MAG: N,N-dimethylformamidase beta subunit family domain-containing protein [Dermatophilaceae bacterium]
MPATRASRRRSIGAVAMAATLACVGMTGCGVGGDDLPGLSTSDGAHVAPATPQEWAGAVRAENEREGSRAWDADVAERGRAGLEAYADRVSVRPGEDVGLYLSLSSAPPTGGVPTTARRSGPPSNADDESAIPKDPTRSPRGHRRRSTVIPSEAQGPARQSPSALPTTPRSATSRATTPQSATSRAVSSQDTTSQPPTAGGTGPEDVQIAAYRIGAYGGSGARQIWSGTARAGAQPAAATIEGPLADVGGVTGTGARVARWTRSLTVPTSGWPEGTYLFTVRSARLGATRFVPLTVRSANARGRLLMLSSPLTYQAYNEWGGASLYHGPDGSLAKRSRAVSFDRPYQQESGAGQFFDMDAPILRVAEGAGLPLAWATDYDLAVDPGLAKDAVGIVLGGHSEYWTPAMRRGVSDAVAAGTNLASFGANTAYWRIRMARSPAREDLPADRSDRRPRVIFASKAAREDPMAATDPRGATVRFRDSPSPSSESTLTGVSYDCNPVRGDWTIADPTWWGFEGSGATEGSRLKGVVGNEIDRAYAGVAGPGPRQVVGYGKVSCRGAETAYSGVYSSTPSGAGVFAAGTLGWPRGITSADPGTARLTAAITARILREFAAEKAGARHPATDTTGLFWLPAERTASHGG